MSFGNYPVKLCNLLSRCEKKPFSSTRSNIFCSFSLHPSLHTGQTGCHPAALTLCDSSGAHCAHMCAQCRRCESRLFLQDRAPRWVALAAGTVKGTLVSCYLFESLSHLMHAKWKQNKKGSDSEPRVDRVCDHIMNDTVFIGMECMRAYVRTYVCVYVCVRVCRRWCKRARQRILHIASPFIQPPLVCMVINHDSPHESPRWIPTPPCVAVPRLHIFLFAFSPPYFLPISSIPCLPCMFPLSISLPHSSHRPTLSCLFRLRVSEVELLHCRSWMSCLWGFISVPAGLCHPAGW